MLSNEDLALACSETECRNCKPEVRSECVMNACWKPDYPRDRACPAVFYGEAPAARMEEVAIEDIVAWRNRWYAERAKLVKPPLQDWQIRELGSFDFDVSKAKSVVYGDVYVMYVWKNDQFMAAEVLDSHYGNRFARWYAEADDALEQIERWTKRANLEFTEVHQIS